jgi:hypothetical protein
MLFVLKKSLTQTEKRINQGKILVAHSDQAVMDKITSLLDKNGYQAVTSSGDHSNPQGNKGVPLSCCY